MFRLIAAACAFFVAVPFVAFAGEGPAAIAPTGKWALAATLGDCTLSRDYGSSAGIITLGFRPDWGGLLGQILLVTPAPAERGMRRSRAEIRVGSAGVPILANAESGVVNGQRITTIFAPDPYGPDARPGDPVLPDPPVAGSITLRIGRDDPLTLAMPAAAAGFAALARCQDALMDKLGIFAYERRHYARDSTSPDAKTPAKGNPGEWITIYDYPMDALRAGMQGDSTLLWTIGTDGSVHDCKTLISSGYPILDKAACDAVTRRGRYAPAVDEQGKPIPMHASRRVSWRLPS